MQSRFGAAANVNQSAGRGAFPRRASKSARDELYPCRAAPYNSRHGHTVDDCLVRFGQPTLSVAAVAIIACARRIPVLPAVVSLLVLPWLYLPGVDAHAQDPRFGAIDDPPTSTYERFLPLAEAGDAEARHLLGYMHFYGEGVELDYDTAHEWFHLAADEGEPKSMRNLGLYHAHAIARIPARFYDPREANLWFSLAAAASSDPQVATAAAASYDRFLADDKASLLDSAPPGKLGETVYTAYCAGCHGFDGYSSYANAPSFALGESLRNSDTHLLTSIGRTLDPWPHRLEGISLQARQAVLAYIRSELAGKPTRVSLSSSLLPAAPAKAPVAAPPGQNRARIALGTSIYSRFCGGCHGFNGIATYVNSPSFALGERLHKSDDELASSIRNGRGEMPSWEFMLKPEEIEALVGYVRTFAQTLQQGIGESLRPDPERYYRFTPKSLLGDGNLHGLTPDD